MSEIGITNLGPVPAGMEFIDAVRHIAEHQRKYIINPHHQSRRLTYCEVIREIWREAEKPYPDMGRIQDLAEVAFDFGKRMDARMKQLKAELAC